MHKRPQQLLLPVIQVAHRCLHELFSTNMIVDLILSHFLIPTTLSLVSSSAMDGIFLFLFAVLRH